jgi:hypothetical protein
MLTLNFVESDPIADIGGRSVVLPVLDLVSTDCLIMWLHGS